MSDISPHLDASPVWLTSALGIGGVLKQSPDDFVVIEEGGPQATGRGDHWLLRVRKRGITTPFVIKQLAEALGVSPHDIGYAGMKDKVALTTQLLTVPARTVTEAMLGALALPDIEILEANLHSKKLRLGFLTGNRFVIVVRDLPDARAAAATATAVLQQLSAPPGVPNWFGGQRFGIHDDNHVIALAMLRGAAPWPRDHRKSRFLASSLQAHWFNAWLRARVVDKLFTEVIVGDWLKKHGGGQFTADDASIETARLRHDELFLMGPMFGAEMRPSPPNSPASAREADVLAAAGLTLADLTAMARHAPGARRAASFALRQASCRILDAHAIELAFWLPSGAYATVVMSEIQKPATTTS